MQLGLDDALNWSEYTKLFVGLLALVTIPSTIPVFITLTRQCKPSVKRRIAAIAANTVACTLILSAWVGTSLLNAFGISIAAFRISGGILIFLSALSMMNSEPSRDEVSDRPEQGIAIGIVPLGIPLLAGPGSISAVIVYGTVHSSVGHLMLVTMVILAVSLVVYLALRLATYIGGILGPIGMQVFSRIMGLILGAIAIEFVVSGIKGSFMT